MAARKLTAHHSYLQFPAFRAEEGAHTLSAEQFLIPRALEEPSFF